MKQQQDNLLLSLSMDPMLDSGNIEQAELAILARCVQGLNITRASIWLYDDAHNAIHCRQIFPTEFNANALPALTRQQYPHYFAALDTNRVINAMDARNDPATREFSEHYLVPLDIWSMLDVPLRYQGKVVGIICCEETKQIKRWTEQDASFVGILSDLYGRALAARDRLYLQQQLADANTQLEARVLQRTEELSNALETLRRTQQDLIQSEKLAALGSLVAGVAHELNTPVGNAITVSSSLAENCAVFQQKRQTALTRNMLENFVNEVEEAAIMLMRNLDRAAGLVSSFKKVAVDQGNQQRQPFLLHELLSEVKLVMTPSLRKSGVSLEVDCEPSIALHSYPGALSQALMILISNAITHAFADSTDPRITIYAKMLDRERVLLSVADNGQGVTPSTLNRIFEPFYTTKLGKGGSGLGMHIFYNLVTATLGGKPQVLNIPSSGLEIRLELPLSAPIIKTQNEVEQR